MAEKNKVISFTAISLAVCVLLGAVFVMGVQADDEEFYFPSLYCNDEVWYKEDLFPLDLYYQTYYVPASLFSYFDGVTVTPNERFGTLLISYTTENTRFISFNTNTDLALSDGMEEFYAMTYTKDGERYVPAELVCRTLGFTFEYTVSNSFSVTAMRICDGEENKDFSELVALYARGDGDDTTSDPETTKEPIIDPPTPVDTKIAYITFDSFSGASVDELLSVLRNHNAKATFFMCNDELRDHEDDVIKMIAAGHSVGLAFDTSGYEADCINAFWTQNEILVRLIKHESRFVRIYGENTDAEIKKAENSEYVVWGWDVSFEDTDVAFSELERVAAENERLTLRFRADKNAPELLDAALSHMENMRFGTRTVNDATARTK